MDKCTNCPAISNEEHIHRGHQCYPTLAGGVAIADGGAPWIPTPAPAQIIPANTILNPFCVVEINVENYDIAPAIFEVALYWGPAAGEVLIGRRRFTLLGAVGPPVTEHLPPFPFRTPVQTARERISGTVASSVGGNSLEMSLGYIIHV